MKTTKTLPLAVLAALLLGGCANPYLDGFTGQAAPPMPESAPVAVIGANRADPLQMRQFDQAYRDAESQHTLLGSSTIMSSNPLRDADAAQAGRELGASLVLYTFEYVNSTVERETQEFRRYDRTDDEHYYDRRSFDTTRHWYEYRAYFFSTGRGAVSAGDGE